MDMHKAESEWSNPNNWRFGIYRSKLDFRVIVPKQNKYGGWTINFGHPRGLLVLIGMIGIVVVPAFLLIQYGRPTPFKMIVLTCASILVLMSVCIWETNRYKE